MVDKQVIKCGVCGQPVPLSEALWAGPAWGMKLTPETQQECHNHFPIGGFVLVGHQECLDPYLRAMMALLSGADAFKTKYGFPEIPSKRSQSNE